MLLEEVNETIYACYTVSQQMVAASVPLSPWASNSSSVNWGQLLLPGVAVMKMN